MQGGRQCGTDVAKPHPLRQLVVALMGLAVVTPDFIKFGGSSGPTVGSHYNILRFGGQPAEIC